MLLHMVSRRSCNYFFEYSCVCVWTRVWEVFGKRLFFGRKQLFVMYGKCVVRAMDLLGPKTKQFIESDRTIECVR